ncbi:MAG: undecaprenyldiphospho-muramoylpentapeptide beta-N-acetylglucosaminyltransferase [Syntrophales bacterium]|nr:undecaprenyldiphospho-muramoylpentapeptide beta-N-acetylglucosaminyltransferase [Syntrophales bacterium]
MMIAGGGTGGHLFPGIAIAEAFLKKDRENEVLFVGTDRGLEKRVLKELGYSLETLDIEGIKGRSWKRSMQAAFKIPGSMMQAYTIISKYSPDVVIGVGGYASGPAVLTAHFMGIKTAIAEQNALPGVTNRILSKFVDKIFLSFPDRGQWFPEARSMVTGNPIRASFAADQNMPEKKEEEPFQILIFGGSQGAHAINMAVLAAAAELEIFREKLKFVHQTGEKDVQEIRDAYKDLNMNAEVQPFIMDMAKAYREADLIICRAGATSVAEITAMGKVAIFVPFPFAINDHQTKNAEILVHAKAAIMIPEKDLSGRHLADTIERLIGHPAIIEDMSKRSNALGNFRAADDVADACIKMAQGATLHGVSLTN